MFIEEFLVLLSADKTCVVFFSSVMLSPVNVARPYLNAGIVTTLAKGCAIPVAHVLKLSSGGLLT